MLVAASFFLATERQDADDPVLPLRVDCHVAPSSQMKGGRFCLVVGAIVCIICSISARAEEEPLPRSSHPRGFANDAPLPPMVASSSKTRSTSMKETGTLPAKSTGNQRDMHIANEGDTAVMGSTRIGARIQEATATSIGQQNTAGNRAGTIGGK